MQGELGVLIATALASGRPTFHEAAPEDFGPDTSRWTLLAGCLTALLEAHPGLSISLVASVVTLRKFGLVPASTRKLGRFRIAVWPGQTDREGAIRIAFCPPGSPLAAPPMGAQERQPVPGALSRESRTSDEPRAPAAAKGHLLTVRERDG